MKSYADPEPHPSWERAPDIPPDRLPGHVAVVMDGNGRWANQRGLSRIEGHKRGEAAMLEAVAGAVELGVPYLSVYAFSTENWRRSPQEVRFLLGFSRQIIRSRRDLLNSWGVRIRWAGRKPRLWPSVIAELEDAEALTKRNDRCTLTIAVNYGGRAEIADAVTAIARQVQAGRLNPDRITEKTIHKHLYLPDVPDVDLFLRTSGEQRLSNFLVWQSAYAELMFTPQLWPDFDRRDFWQACQEYAGRERRMGGAVDQVVAGG